MKLFLLPIILFLTSCSLDKNSAYWSHDSNKNSIQSKKLIKILKKNTDFENMTFEEFDLFLKNYSENAVYPDINN